ncbi:MAG: hypothetical protein Q8P12_05925 [bacterium]|nr:hypothetical protein [bacterium]
MSFDLNGAKAKLENHKKEEKRLGTLLERANGNFPERSENRARRLQDLQSRIIPANEQEIYDLKNGVRAPRSRRLVHW